MNDLADAREEIHVVVARAKGGVEPAPEFLVDRVELGRDVDRQLIAWKGAGTSSQAVSSGNPSVSP